MAYLTVEATLEHATCRLHGYAKRTGTEHYGVGCRRLFNGAKSSAIEVHSTCTLPFVGVASCGCLTPDPEAERCQGARSWRTRTADHKLWVRRRSDCWHRQQRYCHDQEQGFNSFPYLFHLLFVGVFHVAALLLGASPEETLPGQKESRVGACNAIKWPRRVRSRFNGAGIPGLNLIAQVEDYRQRIGSG